MRRQSIYYRIEQLRGMLGDLNDGDRQLGLRLALELARTEAVGVGHPNTERSP